MSKHNNFFSRHSFYTGAFIFSLIYFLRMLYDLIFLDGAKAWEYFGIGVILLFVGLIIYGFAKPND
jgi:hypothetical protein